MVIAAFIISSINIAYNYYLSLVWLLYITRIPFLYMQFTIFALLACNKYISSCNMCVMYEDR